FLFCRPIMKKATHLLLLIAVLALASCRDKQPAEKAPTVPKDHTQEVAANVARLISSAQDGDLVVRLNDDILSSQLRFFNDSDKTFSHSGIVISRGGRKLVCSILPGPPGTNPMVYSPIDSFVDPNTNVVCALFRYDLQPSERAAFVANIEELSNQRIFFDSTVNIRTDDSLYCSEMIYKTLNRATKNRLPFKLEPIPVKMQPTVYKFYRGRFSRDSIAARRMIYIDNLYRIPQCRELMRFRLKYFPEDE
ncbi:MAG: hypothetical protein JWP27_2704, partial [Flaviaesturariibacter sp.]|nr:hypothetical protein [Flaviaesturariibacter sp.]